MNASSRWQDINQLPCSPVLRMRFRSPHMEAIWHTCTVWKILQRVSAYVSLHPLRHPSSLCATRNAWIVSGYNGLFPRMTNEKTAFADIHEWRMIKKEKNHKYALVSNSIYATLTTSLNNGWSRPLNGQQSCSRRHNAMGPIRSTDTHNTHDYLIVCNSSVDKGPDVQHEDST